MFTRRSFVMGGVATSVVGTIPPARAAHLCPPADLPPNFCSSLLDPNRFLSLATPSLQRNTQWCWAACIEMVCRWYGISLSQETIVNRVYGGLQNMPANDMTLTSALNSVWESDEGETFRISSRIYSAQMGLNGVDNNIVIRDLANDRPLLNGSRTHATVVARVDYAGGQVHRVHVIDPWPGAAEPPFFARFLAPDEMRPAQAGGSLRYLASIYID